MKLIDKAKQAAMEGAVTKALEYLEKDPETNIPKLMELVDKFTPQDWYKGQRDAIRNAIQDTDSNWYKLIMNLYQLDPGVRKVFFQNFIVNASLKGSARQEEVAAQNNCNVPWAILLDPTSACNLHCTGCWAAEYGHKLNLDLETIDSIIRQGKELGVYMYIYTGGEPTVRKKDLIKLCEMHPDCEFLSFSNGTLRSGIQSGRFRGSQRRTPWRGNLSEGYACNETVEGQRSSIWSFHLLYRHERRQCKQ